MPKLYNKNRDKDIPSDAIYIGRGSKWGNPYIIGLLSRDEVCDLYEATFKLWQDLEELRGKVLL